VGEVVASRLSVIIPVKHDLRLVRCLAALAGQTLEPDRFDVLVVDNAADGSAASMAASAGVGYLRHADGGSYAARSAGAAHASGDVLVFTDADCVPAATWLASIAGLFDDAAREVVIGPSSSTVESVVAAWVQDVDEARWRRVAASPAVAFCDTRNLAIRRSVLEAVPFDPSFRQAGDVDLGIRLHKAGHAITPEPSLRLRHDHPQTLWAVLRRAVRRGRGLARLDAKHGLTDAPMGQRPLSFAGRDLKRPLLRLGRARLTRPLVLGVAVVSLTVLTPALAIVARLGGLGETGNRMFVTFERISLFVGRVLG